ncbi:MAG: polysaccharide biosynthesis/export family protein, partial [Paramuribaculum sp.]|nr:polysaccharide biosynthesis/export family protein [Paramuribaculum sp.]
MKHSFLPIIILLTIIASSCSTHKNHLSYLSALPDAKEGKLTSTEYSIKIVPEDELEIVVTSTMPAATAEYNLPASNAQYSAGQNSIISTTEQQKYIVNKNGDIDFPVLGKIHVAGMSTLELKNYLTSRIEENVTDPKVKVRLLNFKVNVMG